LCEKKARKTKQGRGRREITIQQNRAHVFVDPVITRHNDSSSTCGADEKERKSENRKQKKNYIIVKAPGLES
jgi:hypothetical protein